jgi:8-oxo-dGTP diphosphatase
MIAETNLERPKVGVGVIVIKNDLVLLGKRKSSHGNGSWGFPGGHLELNETIEACAKREVEEETGLTITDMKSGPYTNDIFIEDKKHFVTLFVIAKAPNKEPKIMEPQKCDEWRWFRWDELPEPLFLPIINLKKSGFSPFK